MKVYHVFNSLDRNVKDTTTRDWNNYCMIHLILINYVDTKITTYI